MTRRKTKIRRDFVTDHSSSTFVLSGSTRNFKCCEDCIISPNCNELCEKGQKFMTDSINNKLKEDNVEWKRG